jgi:hypothetical protein
VVSFTGSSEGGILLIQIISTCLSSAYRKAGGRGGSAPCDYHLQQLMVPSIIFDVSTNMPLLGICGVLHRVE